MEDLAYRIRTAEPEDDAELRRSIGVTISHPDGKGRRASFRSAIQRGEVLVLEHYETREHAWTIVGFVEYHVRVDDNVTIKDAGSSGDSPRAAVIKQLVAELLRSSAARGAMAKVRSDASEWNELLGSIPGFLLEGKEYRRPHYYAIWEWSPERARQESRRPPRGMRRR